MGEKELLDYFINSLHPRGEAHCYVAVSFSCSVRDYTYFLEKNFLVEILFCYLGENSVTNQYDVLYKLLQKMDGKLQQNNISMFLLFLWNVFTFLAKRTQILSVFSIVCSCPNNATCITVCIIPHHCYCRRP